MYILVALAFAATRHCPFSPRSAVGASRPQVNQAGCEGLWQEAVKDPRAWRADIRALCAKGKDGH